MDIPVTPDLTATCWRDELFLASYKLSVSNVLDYFSASPFYDVTSLNALARLRGLAVDEIPKLGAGTEFILKDAQAPHLFVIFKRLRSVSGVSTPLAYYYVLDGTVYQAPTLDATLSSRLSKCCHLLRESFHELEKDLNPLMQATSQEFDADAITKKMASHTDRERLHALELNLKNVLNQYPMPVPTHAHGPKGQ